MYGMLLQNFSTRVYTTVLYLWVGGKQFSSKLIIFDVLTGPLGRNFHADPKTDLNKFHTISERHNIFNWIFGEMMIQLFKNCIGKAGLNLNSYREQSTDSSDVRTFNVS
jgi:hypothetical protein